MRFRRHPCVDPGDTALPHQELDELLLLHVALGHSNGSSHDVVRRPHRRFSVMGLDMGSRRHDHQACGTSNRRGRRAPGRRAPRRRGRRAPGRALALAILRLRAAAAGARTATPALRLRALGARTATPASAPALASAAPASRRRHGHFGQRSWARRAATMLSPAQAIARVLS